MRRRGKARRSTAICCPGPICGWTRFFRGQQDDLALSVRHLMELGPALGFPHSSKVTSSRYPQMRELRTQSAGRPWRTLYAFDPLRTAILIDCRRQNWRRPVVRQVCAGGGPAFRRTPERTQEGGKALRPTHNFRELLEVMPAARQQRIEKRFQKSLAAMPLDQLRKAQQMTQLRLAEVLGINQADVSKIEHSSDIRVSTLADYVEAIGGRLEIRAVFKDREVRISQFEELRSEERRVGKECRSRWS